MNVNKIIGERIRQLRALKGLSQDNVADEIGMSAGNFGKIERGEIDVSASNLIQIAKVLGVQVSNLFDDKPIATISEPKTDFGYATKEELYQVAQALQSLAKQIENLREELPTKKTIKKTKDKSDKK